MLERNHVQGSAHHRNSDRSSGELIVCSVFHQHDVKGPSGSVRPLVLVKTLFFVDQTITHLLQDSIPRLPGFPASNQINIGCDPRETVLNYSETPDEQEFQPLC